jgi:hypothetical protein
VKAGHEHEFEAAPGLPEPLPAGEKIVWQGAPQWGQLALHAFHVGKVAIYFGVMLALQLGFLMNSDASFHDTWVSLAKSLAVCLLALAMLGTVARLASRTTLYTITDKRVVMRIGIVLTLTFNLPYKRISGASLKSFRGSTGDIALGLYPADRIAWMHLWPHARAWHIAQPEPTLRCLKDADKVGELLFAAWRHEHAGQSPVAAAAASPGLTLRQGLPA